MVCHDEETKDWLAAKVPTLLAWEDFRLKLVSLDALPIYKGVEAWFPGPAEDTAHYLLRLRRLNRGLNTGQSRVYEHTETDSVRLVLSIDPASIATLEKLQWRPFSGVEEAIFSLLGVKPEGRK